MGLIAFMSFSLCGLAQAPAIRWDKLIGGAAAEAADVKSVQPTSDGGFVIAGSSASSQSGDVTGVNHGGLDCWIVKLDADGNKVWDKLLGGTGDDQASAIRQTADGGYVFSASSFSSQSGDVSGVNHAAGSSDLWIVKLDANGSIVWNKLLGSINNEATQSSIAVTSDGGYIAVASSTSTGISTPGGDITGDYRGGTDAWIIKLDADGNKQWDRLFGGQNADILSTVEQLADGTYIFAGQSNSPIRTGDITSSFNQLFVNPYPDAFAVKLDAAGNAIWDKRYGSFGMEVATSIHPTADGGYIMSSSTSLGGLFGAGDITGPFHGASSDQDCWVVKMDADGNKTWDRLLGSDGADGGSSSVQQTADGGYIVTCASFGSASGDVTGTNHGRADIWMVKLGTAGNKLWDRLLGGPQDETPGNVVQLGDNGFILAGNSTSSQGGDVTGVNHGTQDIWVLRFSPESTGGALPVSLISFTASQQAENVQLSWSTALEQNSRDFIVQRSADRLSWTNLDSIGAAGESTTEKHYHYTDTHPVYPNSNYRLLQRDKDDRFSFSWVKSVNLSVPATALKLLVNPVSNGKLQLEVPAPATIEIFNMHGLLLIQKKLTAGRQNVLVANLAKGSYILKSGKVSRLFIVQ